MYRLAKQKSNKANGYFYFRETFKKQNINHISPTPKFTLGIIQIIIKGLSTSFSA